MPRTLILMRHGEAARSAAGGDHARPLTPHGTDQARTAGAWLAARAEPVDAVVCSTAERTRGTLEAVARGAGWAAGTADPGSARAGAPRTGSAAQAGPAVHYARGVYAAGGADVLAEIALTEESVRTLLIIGHVPGLPEAALMLAPAGPGAEALGRGLPTAARIVVGVDERWASLPGAAYGSPEPYGRIIEVAAD